MKSKDRAANDVKFAQSLDLQLFNDEEPIELTEPIEEPVEPVEPTEPVTEPTEPVVEDVTQTQAFARRLKEETARVEQEAVDKYVASKGYVWNGKPITTEAEYQQALYEQELQEAGQDPEMVAKLVNEHPDVKAARIERESAQRQQKIYTEWVELVEEHPEIKDIKQIPAEVFALKDSKGIPLLDAFNRLHIKKVRQETEQETIRKIQKNAATSPGSALDDGVIHKAKSVDDMTAEEFEAYREEVRRQRKE